MNSRLLANTMRVLALQMVTRAKASHIGSALSIIDLVAVLYADVLSVDPGNPQWSERDRFILSKGHACVALYAALAAQGFFPLPELEEYGRDFSDLMNHISHKVSGVEFSTGSLGHGLPFAVGKALAGKRGGKGWRVCVLVSDGEMDEGSNWEALLFAAHHRLDNLLLLIDYNKLQSLTTVAETLALEPLAEKLRAFGWAVTEVDGHDHEAVRSACKGFPWQVGKPSVLLAHTVKGKGVSFMENQVVWHYRNPSEEQLAQALEELAQAREAG
ncbi:transketolase [Candidatus Magnetaquicoccus inordinatus]|uniref:transketolase n=1 Tax=Candidatus Magnetaquicoccus inordinatus TaxID=2496818 RepID=UPI00102CF68F|nr:transketolase [Candidatus Magnetaquicoccus inordinatus]